MNNHQPPNYECPFCVVSKGGETELNKRGDIVFDDGNIMAFISPKWWPNNPGNVIVIPHKHVENIYDISEDLLAEVNMIGKKVALAMKESYMCDGISFRQHNELAGDQEIWHFHLHVFPRWKDDELYLNHKKSRYISLEERRPYADKLKPMIIHRT